MLSNGIFATKIELIYTHKSVFIAKMQISCYNVTVFSYCLYTNDSASQFFG